MITFQFNKTAQVFPAVMKCTTKVKAVSYFSCRIINFRRRCLLLRFWILNGQHEVKRCTQNQWWVWFQAWFMKIFHILMCQSHNSVAEWISEKRMSTEPRCDRLATVRRAIGSSGRNPRGLLAPRNPLSQNKSDRCVISPLWLCSSPHPLPQDHQSQMRP